MTALLPVSLAGASPATGASTGPLAGSAGTDTALAPTDSAVTVRGRACAADPDDGCGFQNLAITVNQTKQLLNQAVSVTWTGGTPTSRESGDSGVFAGNYLQIFQCWGDDDGTNPSNPGPPPEKCEFGGFQSNPKAAASLQLGGQFVNSRVVGPSSDGPADGFVDQAQGLVWKPFQAVDGTVIKRSANFAANSPYARGTGGYWLNGYFDYTTTNEDVIAVTHPDGTGSELFTVATGLEANGLGCGQRMEQVADGSKRVPRCWLVIVPRGTGPQENPPNYTSSQPVGTSPLAATSWRNRIAVPLEFRPVDASCTIGADERRIAGSELATPAIVNWQPRLCAVPGSPPYSYTSMSDELARQQLVSATPGAAGMIVVSRPIDPAKLDPDNPIVYAPISLSGLVIGFNVERVPATTATGALKDPAEGPLSGIRVARLNLTPRLVAKLLSESYTYQFGGNRPSYDWIADNPNHLFADPDFVQFNPEFDNLGAGSLGAGRLIVEQPSSDAAYAIWSWVLADPEAARWMAGESDQWGMNVNPVYNIDAGRSPSGTAFGDPIPISYPKSDPFCVQSGESLPLAGGQKPRPLCMFDFAPYVNSMQVAALATRTANDGARTDLDSGATSPDTAWVPAGPQYSGLRAMLSVTDSASAARFGLQTARLSRSGDNTPNRAFVAPDTAALLAGQRAMVSSGVDGVLQAQPATAAPGAYPLAMLTYAAAPPRSLDAAAGKDYRAFVDFAVGDGQTPGLEAGQLPPGYAPLPADLRAQARAAAAVIAAGGPPKVEATSVDPGTTPSAPTEPGPPPVAVPDEPEVIATPSPPLTAGPAVTTGAPAARARPAGKAAAPAKRAVAAMRPRPPGITAAQVAGMIRLAVPVVVCVGLLGLLGALIIDDRARHRAISGPARGPSLGASTQS